MTLLVLKDLRHHAGTWVFSLLVAVTGGTFISVTMSSWYSAHHWAQGQANVQELELASSIIGSNLVGYAGLATAVVLASTLALTITAQRRSHALWKVVGIPAAHIRRIVTAQVALVGLIGGALGTALSPVATGWYLCSWQEFDLFPADMPVLLPWWAPLLTLTLTTVFCVLGGLGAARRAASTSEMQALREAAAPQARTHVWQWVAAGVLILATVMLPVLHLMDEKALVAGDFDAVSAAEQAEELAALQEIMTPAGRATTGGAMGLTLALAALCIPAWTLRPLLVAWTGLVHTRSTAWFAARANAVHRSSLSLTTITPFAIAVGMTGAVYATVGAGRALGSTGGVNGFLAVAVPIFIVTGVGGVANIAMVGGARRREGALLGVLGASRATMLRSTVLEGTIYAVTGILFGLAVCLFSATASAVFSGGGLTVLVHALPLSTLLPVVAACLVLSVATTWIPSALDRKPAFERLRVPV